MNATGLLAHSLQRATQELVARSMALVVAETATFVLINAISLVGNFLVFLVAFRNPSLKTVTGLLLLSLTTSHFLASIIVMPMSVGVLATGGKFMGSLGCQILAYSSQILSNMTVYTICLIAVNRLLFFVKSSWYRAIFGFKSTLTTIATSWIFQLVYAFIPAFASWSVASLYPGYAVCTSQLTNKAASIIYGAQNDVQILGGVVILIICYLVVFVKIRKASKITPEVAQDLPSDNELNQVAPIQGLDEMSTQKELEKKRDENKALKKGEKAIEKCTIDQIQQDSGTAFNGCKEEIQSNGLKYQTNSENIDSQTDFASPNDPEEGQRQAVELQDPEFRAEVHMTRTVFLVTVCLIVCYIPLLVILEVESWQIHLEARQVELFGMALQYLGSALTPVVIAIFNIPFRRELKDMFCRGRENRRVHPAE
ncbi:tyramine receptor Ser-2 [Nematostella vectensis]|uniref:tyramine receptor Ser-2 n=1 Tax=Nematostella vectensis TaxID=45351 RepID=UPI002076FCFC|nr:tyramine receptor Ser-2 [Nematostella vectensis]